MSASDLVMAYNKLNNQRITGGIQINILYWSDDDSSGDDCKPVKKQLGIKKSNINKYIKKK